MKKILILTIWFDWWWVWKIASIVENFLNKSHETTTLVFFEDKWIFNIKWKKINIWTLSNFSFPWRWYIELIPHIIKTIKHIQKEKPDVVIWVWTYCNLLWLIAKKFQKFKLLLTQHEHITSRKNNTSIFSIYNLIYFMTKIMIWNNKIVCVSNEVKFDTIQHYWIKETQTQTIYNWLNFDEIKRLWNEQINIQDKYIINIWRLCSCKNQELLINAYSKSKIKDKYKLLLLWKWDIDDYLKNLCEKLNIENSVIFAWFDKNPYKYLKKASLFCFTSKTESFWLVLLEALILWVPIITVPVTWAKEILDNWNFWTIIKDWDEQSLIKELDKFVKLKKGKLEDNNKLNYLYNNFSIKTMEEKYMKTIEDL